MMPASAVLIVTPDFHNAVASDSRAASKRMKPNRHHRPPASDAGWHLTPIGGHASRKSLAIFFE